MRPANLPRLSGERLQAGLWEAVLDLPTGAPPPGIEALHGDRALPGVTACADPDRPGRHRLSVPIPADLLSDGVQNVLIRDCNTGATLAHVSILAGAVLERDVRAELDQMRAELDLLKRAFRDHCREIPLFPRVSHRSGS
ncbi:hypothetical protein [Rhodovulum kholense]|uniref:Uncharacterized protein n=1 Tax=Rhodovulum kholense TaxID=453584 RepID=A0A8E3AS14_9RHOB|nr:hypothetical protein [Rhodovulum kholense]PTW50395.1 hypothetical protein C8N38_10429 [Rhodovulum kholense]